MPCTTFGVFSTLGTDVRDTLETSGVSLVIDLVIRLEVSSNGCIVFTLGSEWVMPSSYSTLVCGAGFDGVVMALLFLTAFCVSCRIFCISYAPLLLPMFLIEMEQSAMAAIILSAWVMVGFVIFLCLNCAVLVNLSLSVVLMWQICAQ